VLDSKNKVSDISLLKLSVFWRGTSNLSAVECGKEIRWSIKRVFMIVSQGEEERGNHAHKECSQALICNIGKIDIFCSDGNQEKTFQLTSAGEILIVPPGIWLKLRFQTNSAITVLASHKFSETDYIRSWDEYIKYRNLL
jgi:hypothetical protein